MANQWLRVKCTFSSTCAGQLGHVCSVPPAVTLVSNTASATAQGYTYSTVFECPLMSGNSFRPLVSQGLEINYNEENPVVRPKFSAFTQFKEREVNTLSTSVSTWGVDPLSHVHPGLQGAFLCTVVLENGKFTAFVVRGSDQEPQVYTGTCGPNDEYAFRFEVEVFSPSEWHAHWRRRVQEAWIHWPHATHRSTVPAPM